MHIIAIQPVSEDTYMLSPQHATVQQPLANTASILATTQLEPTVQLDNH